MIRGAEPTYEFILRRLPKQWARRITHIDVGTPQNLSSDNLWRALIKAMVANTLVYGILSAATITIMFSLVLPIMRNFSVELTGNHWAGNAVCGFLTILFIAPFLRAFVMKKNHSEEFKTLWTRNRMNRLPLVFTISRQNCCGTCVHFLHLQLSYTLHQCTYDSHCNRYANAHDTVSRYETAQHSLGTPLYTKPS